MFSNVGKRIKTPVLLCSAIIGGVGGVLLLKEFLGGKKYEGSPKAEGKVIIVTGANTGIGKETVRDLAKRGAKVYMACRDLEKCEETRKEIVLETKNKYVYCRQCDLASLESIRKFADIFKKEEQKLDVLINNAGVMRLPSNTKTKEGFEMQLGVNHFGHFLLTNLLLDLLKQSSPSRVINVSSIAHKNGVIKKDDLNSDIKYDGAEAYNQSKLANVLFTRALAKKLEGTGVTVNAVHPGIVNTNIVRHMSFANSWVAAIFVKPFMYPFIKNPRHGAQPLVFLALDDSIKNVTGKYYSCYDEEELGDNAKDDKTCDWLWKVSEKWTRLVT